MQRRPTHGPVLIRICSLTLLSPPPCVQTGCGAMIFTLFGYLLLIGAVRRDVRSAIVSVAVFVMYGGLLWALLPIKDREVRHRGKTMRARAI